MAHLGVKSIERRARNSSDTPIRFSQAEMDKKVQQWWKKKAKEIYATIPDFGGFLVKANSEGQPGPGSQYHRHRN